MSAATDIAVIEDQPRTKLWGEDLDDFKAIKAYKGKFVLSDEGQFFAKLFPKREWDSVSFFHDDLIRELGVKDAKSMDVKEVIIGGGKIEIELFDDYAECRLYGKSTVYGDYNPNDIDTTALETEIRDTFELGDEPVLIVPDFEE
ncbi:hypothetical protein JW752_04825 [Candidatus Peregrinibacteria bacterium]|nr:hypothetical protein [Candidatus Peregrinibacteria bacterium]